LNKGDFLRTGSRGALYLSFRKAIQEVVTEQLSAWGEPPASRRQARTRPMERDLDRVLGELAGDFPLLAALAERRAGGQRRLPLADPGASVPDLPGLGIAGAGETITGSAGAPDVGAPNGGGKREGNGSDGHDGTGSATPHPAGAAEEP